MPAYPSVLELRKGDAFTVDRSFVRNYVRRFQVELDPAVFPPLDARGVMLALNYALGTTFPSDPWAAVLGIDGECTTDDGLTWECNVHYGPFDPRIVENPLDMPVEVEWDAIQFEAIAYVDRATGAAITNSALDYFDPPVPRDDSRIVGRFQVNLPDPLDPSILLLKDRINADPFLGWDTHTLKCAPIKARRQFHPAVPGAGFYWSLAVELYAEPATWDPQILDQGLRSLDTAATPPTRHQVTVDGSLATAPVLLDGRGGVLATDASPVFLPFQTYEEAVFADAFPWLSGS